MVDVELVIEMPGGRVASRVAALPGVPSAGDIMWVTPTIPLLVEGVVWRPETSSVLVAFRRAALTPAALVEHDHGLFLDIPDAYKAEFETAGWAFEDSD